jgi:hypothetical protein
MTKYLVIIRPSSEEEPYIVDIFPSEGDRGSHVRHKLYDTDNLRQDMKDCLNTTEDGFLNVLKIISQAGVYSVERVLTSACASRLGWFE